MVDTDPRYWDCECLFNYIHLKTDRVECPICGATEPDSPDSHLNEIANSEAHYNPDIWCVISRRSEHEDDFPPPFAVVELKDSGIKEGVARALKGVGLADVKVWEVDYLMKRVRFTHTKDGTELFTHVDYELVRKF